MVATIRRTRPQVVVTYDDFGQYGHPDHIQAHRVTSYALVLAAAPSFRPDLGEAWEVAKVYWTALPKAAVKKGIDAFVAAGGQGFFGLAEGEDLPWALDDELVTTCDHGARPGAAQDGSTPGPPHPGGRRRTTSSGCLSSLGPEAMGIEYFRLARGQLGPAGADGLEDDLFAGLS